LESLINDIENKGSLLVTSSQTYEHTVRYLSYITDDMNSNTVSNNFSCQSYAIGETIHVTLKYHQTQMHLPSQTSVIDKLA
jgi:hypothetical protein